MSVIKIQHRDNPYAIIDKNCLDDVRLSWKARGLLASLLSRPQNWAVRIYHLIHQAPEGRDAVYAILKELITVGYIERVQSRCAEGKIRGWDYIVYEVSQNPLQANTEVDEKGGKIPDQETPNVAKPYTEKPYALINKDINNKYLNKAAAEQGNVKSNLPNSNRVSIAAAAFEKNDEDKNSRIEKSIKTSSANSQQQQISKRPIQAESLLGNQLTPAQQDWVRKKLMPLAKFCAKDFSVLIDQVTTVLLDSDSFKKTGRDFHHKLNAIVKEIKSGRWQTPAKLLLAEEQQVTAIIEKKNCQHKALREELQEQHSDRTYWQKMLTYSKREEDVAFYQDNINRCDFAIAELQQKINMKEGNPTC